MRTFIFSMLLVSSIASAAELSPTEKQCLLRSPVILGASVTAETARSKLYASLMTPIFLAHLRSPFVEFGVSPSRLLYENYGGKTDYKSLKNDSRMFTRSEDDEGHSQIRQLLNGKNRAAFDKASVVIGLDVFYWDGYDNYCTQDPEDPNGVQYAIKQLISQARAQGTKLILGNVPEEDASKVLIYDANNPDSPVSFWYPPVDGGGCIATVNALLQEMCTYENGCYLLDLHSIVSHLNTDGHLTLRDGSTINYDQTRPDGIHLSPKGWQYAYEQVLDRLEEKPFQCGQSGR